MCRVVVAIDWKLLWTNYSITSNHLKNLTMHQSIILHMNDLKFYIQGF